MSQYQDALLEHSSGQWVNGIVDLSTYTIHNPYASVLFQAPGCTTDVWTTVHASKVALKGMVQA